MNVRPTLPLYRYFAIEALLGATSWQSSGAAKAGTPRNLSLDLAFAPEPKLPITQELEPYLALRIEFWNEIAGTSFVVIRQETNGPEFALPADASAEPALGWIVSPALGVRWAISDFVGLCFEFGFKWRKFGATVEFEPRSAPAVHQDASVIA